MKIYTKTGDLGTTGLFAGGRVPKDHPRIAAYGSVDELNALLGLVMAHAATLQANCQQAAKELAPQDESQRSSSKQPSGAGAPSPAQQLARITTLAQILQQSQHDLFAIGAELATPEPSRHGTKMLSNKDVERLEHDIDRLEDQLSPLTNFVIPGGSELSGWLHWARTVCRRAERDVVHLAHQPEVDDCSTVIVYLNRLSDLLFVMARAANQALHVPDVPWQKPR